MELELKVNINDLPLEALILIAASKRKVNVKVSNETCLSVKDNVVFSSNISAMRYLANTDQSYKWMGTSALEKCEINHWITYSFGPLSGKDSFEESLVYLDRVIAPVTFLVGDKCSLADIVVWSKLFNLPKWIDLLQSNKTPVNVTRWYTFIASLDYVEEAVRQIGSLTNNLPVEKMKKETKFSNAAPQETGRKDEGKFVELPGAEMGKVVVRFPPEASGYLHIGHAKAALLNQYYKEAFNGQLIMRFDDTNPAKEKEDFEKVILEDLKLLNINYDKFTRTSNYFDVMLEMCEKLIKDGKAYVDDTNAEEMKKEREKKVCSKNRDNTVDKNMLMWNEMKNGTEKGQTCCVRAKIDMSSLNGCMRDPTIYRCKNEPHPLTGNKYKVYPTYDFACPIVDSLEGVTHCLRTMEYHDRDEQFYWFIDVLGLRKPYIWEYSRLNMTNTVLSKRKLTWFVENKYVDGWDDPRMPTVRGVLRRGMTVEGLKQFIIAQGSSRSVVLMEWDKIWAFNKKVIDPIAPRYTAVDALRNVTVSILNVTESSMQVAKHPKNNEVGDKTIWVAPKLLVDEADATEFKENENVTFINWGNITVNKIIKKDNKIMEIVATPNLEDKNYKKTLKITWLAGTKQGPLIPVTCLYFEHIISKPILGKDEDFKQYIDHTTMFKAEMLGEPALASVKKSDIIQLQRKGFFICDQPYSSPNAYTFKASPLVLIYIPDGHSKGLPSGLIEVERNPVCASKDNYIEFIKQFIEKEEAVCNMFSAGKESDDLDGKIQELILLKENCDAIISSVGAEIGYEKTKRIHNLLSKVATLARKIRNLKAEKADRNVIEENSKALLELKASYTEITGRPWNSEPLINVKNVSNSKLEMPSQNDQPDKTSLSLKITEAGNKVRKLKADKADKTVIDQHVKLLLKLKADFKSLTGNDWTPDSSSDKTEDKNCSDVNELLKKITEVGNKIRTLKSNKSSKNLIDEEVKVLLQLKCNYKNLTGKEWTPALNVSSSEKQTKTSTDSNDLSNKIKLQGDKVRQLKGNKVEKSIIDAEVKVLLALKSEFKSSTGKDWVPDNTEKKADVKTSGNDSSVLSNKIKLQGDKVRQLKGNKADKSIIDAEVKALLALKSEYKTFTGKDWIPETTEKKTDVKNSGNETKTTNDIIDLSNNIRAQGDKVRQLKGNKADKSIVDAEVKVLLALKSEFKSSTGKDWVPDNTEKTMKNTSETKQMELNSDASSLTNKIKDQGNLVRTLKANSADKHQINEAVEKLLSLKSEYKAVTGQDFPSEGKVPSKKTKNSSDDASKKVQSPKIKASKQENKLESETGLKKITRLGLEAKKEENLPDWYSQIIVKSELIEYYDISGCYILRPWSYAIWEAIKDFFDAKIKLLGVKNCYFPIFVSKAVLEKEKTHIADFAPEVAWVTKSGDSDLAEPIAVRPTSETVMYPAYAKWIQSYRDLPIKLNQWNNVVRWEFKHPQPFLRTREFLWQEGHTAFATYEEAEAEVYTILEYYAAIYTDLLAIPVVKGRKTEKEKFAGGDFTLTVEAYISASGRAIQGGTSHHLGQNFSKMFEIIFEDPVTQEKKFVFQNSWGITTRTIGVLIMVHADNQGLVLPPRVASIQVVIVPCGITASLKQSDKVMLLNMCGTVCNMLKENGVRSEFDERDNYSPGWKFNHWELKGVPIRVELGPKDMQQQQIVAVRRDTGQKITIPSKNIVSEIKSLLDEIQSALLSKATDELNQHKIVCKDWKMFCQQLDKKNILLSPFCGRIECEDKIKEESARNDAEVDVNAPSMGAKSLCIPFEQPAKISNEDRCIHPSCGVKPEFYCLFGRSY